MRCSLVKGVISSRFSQFGLFKVWSNPSTWSSWTWTSASCWRDSVGLQQALGFSTRCLNCRGMSALKWQQTWHLKFFFTAYHSIFGKLSNVECYFAKHLKTRSSKETWTNLHFNWHFQVLFFSPPLGWVGLDTTTLGCIEGLWRYCQTLTQGESTGGADRDTDGIPGLGDMFVGLSLLFGAASVDCCLYVLRLLCVFCCWHWCW